MAKSQGRRPSKAELKAIAIENEAVQIPRLVADSPALAAAIERSVSYSSMPPKTDIPSSADKKKTTRFTFVENDSLEAARELVGRFGSDRVAVLNMANALQPGGGHQGDPSGYLTGIAGQEQALCRRSTLYSHIHKPTFYPFAEEGGIWSEGVRVFRQDDSQHCALLPSKDQFEVNVISAAAIDRRRFGYGKAPSLSPEEEKLTFNKIKSLLRIAKIRRQRALVLGAFGCGAFNNPPATIAKLFLRALTRTAEFKNAFQRVTFAIRDSAGANWRAFNSEWKEVLDAQEGEDDVEPWSSDDEVEKAKEADEPLKKRQRVVAGADEEETRPASK